MSTAVRRCSGCASHVAVRKDGNIRHHLGDWWVAGKPTVCKGAGKPPASAGGTETSGEEEQPS